MDKQVIMICLEKLDIGGVETAVVNQVYKFRKLGHEVLVLAKKGVYTETIEKAGAKFIECEFQLSNVIDTNKIMYMVDIIKDYKVTQIHVHQFPCIPYVLYACVITNIPYISYVHTSYEAFKDESNNNIYNWYINNFPIYKKMFELFFNNADAIIAITNFVKKYLINRFKLNSEKIKVIPNSINFDIFSNDINKFNTIQKVMLISRLAKEKIQAIFYAIDFYIKLTNTSDKECSLIILGDGDKRKEVEEYLASRNVKNYKFIGAVNNVSEIMKNVDLVIGESRCILEAIAMKKIALVTGKYGIEEFVNISNIQEYINKNFTAIYKKEKNLNETVKNVLNLSSVNIKEVVEENYKYIYQRLNIDNNIFFINRKYINYNYSDFFICMLDAYAINNNSYNKILSDKNEYIDFLIRDNKIKENIIKENEKEITKINHELVAIKSGKIYKVIQKTKLILKRSNR